MGFFHPPTASNHKNPVTITSTSTWSWRQAFQIFTTVLLSLLFPLSFLLLASLSAAPFLVSFSSTTTISLQPHPSSSTPIISRLFFSTGASIILYALVSLVSASAFLHALTSPAPLAFDLSSPFPQPTEAAISCRPTPTPTPTTRLYVAWVVLCTFQVCVGLGIEASISANIDGSGFRSQCNLVIRALLLVGLHETMVFWSNTVVKPVVDDTVLVGSSSFLSTSSSSGSNNYIRRVVGVERVGMGLGIGALWWWKLREEVDSLVAVPEVMLAAGSGGIQGVGGVGGLVGWWLYYLTVSMGTMRALKAVVWMGRMGMVASGVAQQPVCKNEGEKKSRKENGPSPPLTPSSSCSLTATNHHHHQPTLEDMV